jgi:hypothetical protein
MPLPPPVTTTTLPATCIATLRLLKPQANTRSSTAV